MLSVEKFGSVHWKAISTSISCSIIIITNEGKEQKYEAENAVFDSPIVIYQHDKYFAGLYTLEQAINLSESNPMILNKRIGDSKFYPYGSSIEEENKSIFQSNFPKRKIIIIS